MQLRQKIDEAMTTIKGRKEGNKGGKGEEWI